MSNRPLYGQGHERRTPTAWDNGNVYMNPSFRGRSISPSAWDSGYMQKDYHQRAIQTPVYPLKTKGGHDTHHQVVDVNEEEEESSGCCSCVVKCTEETSFAGMKYIGGNDSTLFRRLFWFLIVVAALIGLLVQLHRSTQKFIELGTVTNLKYVTEDSVDFPSITICNTNMFRLEQLVEFYGSWIAALFYGLRQLRQLFPQLGISQEAVSEEFLQDAYPGDLDLLDFVKTSAHSIDTMMILCEFNGQECGPANFTKTITNFGVCYTFNSIKIEDKLSVHTAGQRHGLSMVLHAEERSVVAAPRENLGFKVLVHPRDEVPNLQDYGIELQPGTHIPIRLDVTKMATLGKPYGECGSRTLKYYEGAYTESKCYLECETDYIVSQCGCRNFYMQGNASFCSPVELTKCFYNASDTFAANKKILCSCPDACKETLYKPTVSQTSFPSLGVATTFLVRGETEVPAMAFAEAVREAASNHFICGLYQDVTQAVFSVEYGVPGQNNSNNMSMLQVFPNTTYVLAQIFMDDIYGNMQFEIFNKISDYLYYQIVLEIVTFELGSDIYWEEYQSYSERWLGSGVYKEKIARGFRETGEYEPYIIGNYTFDKFIDYVYDDFRFEDFYFTAFPELYGATYDVLAAYGDHVNINQDKTRMITDFMGKNILHVEVFLGDLKVEHITEQPSYEVFQFVCDLGGALGLFFGASLLSFIETMDFWFSHGCCASSKKEKEKHKSPEAGDPRI